MLSLLLPLLSIGFNLYMIYRQINYSYVIEYSIYHDKKSKVHFFDYETHSQKINKYCLVMYKLSNFIVGKLSSIKTSRLQVPGVPNQEKNPRVLRF